MSLLGGVGWVVQTRPDVITYVGALQRNLKKPKAVHLRRLNRVVRYLQTHPLCIRYHKVPAPTKLGVISDSAFRADEPDCLAIKSGIIGLMHDSKTSFSGKFSPIEWISRKQQHVCRSTYGAELHSALDIVGMSMIVASAFNEIMFGTQSALTLSQWQDTGRFAIPLELFIDAKSVFDAVCGEITKCSDKSLVLHTKALHDYVVSGKLRKFHWIDTRDMVADALNKGTIDRSAVRSLFQDSIWKTSHLNVSYAHKTKP